MPKKNKQKIKKTKVPNSSKAVESQNLQVPSEKKAWIFESGIQNILQELNLDHAGHVLNAEGKQNISNILTIASNNKDHQLVASIKKYGFDVNQVTKILEDRLYNLSTFELIKELINGLDDNSLNQLKAYTDKDNNPLLHIACALGRQDVIEYLIKDKGFDVNQITEEPKTTPLQLAVRYNKPEIVKTLLSLGASNPITPPNANDLTPMDEAVRTNNLLIIKILGENDNKRIKMKTTEAKNLKNTEKLYQRLEPPKLTEYSVPLSNKIMNEYYNVIFNENKEIHVNQYRALWQELGSNPPSKEIVQALCQYLNKMFTMCNIYENKQFITNIVEIVERKGDSNTLGQLYHQLSIHQRYNDSNEARNYAQKAINIYQNAPQSFSDEEINKIYVNAAQRNLYYDEDKALEHLIEAEKHDPDNKNAEIVVLQYYIYHLRNSPIPVQKVRQQNSEVIDKIFTIQKSFTQEKISSTELVNQLQQLNISAIDSPKAHKHYIDLVSPYLPDKSARIQELDHLISNDPYNYNSFADNLYEILKIFHAQGDFQGGIEYLENIYSRYPHLNKNYNHLPLLGYEFQLYEAHGLYKEATFKLEQLNSYTYINSSYRKEALDKAHKIRFGTELERKNFDQAEYHLSFTSYNQEVVKVQLKIMRDNAAKFKGEYKTTEDTLEDPVLMDAIIESTLSTIPDTIPVDEKTPATEDKTLETSYDEDPYASIDPRVIHHYYQREKAKLIKKTIEAPSIKSDNISWILPTGDKMHLGEKGVVEIQGKTNFYAIIEPTLISKISASDPTVAEAFTHSLEKGVVSKSYCSNGVKFLNKHRAEIKIDSDLRIYSTKIYKNEDGKYLLIFDKHGNHKDVAKTLQNTKILVESVLRDKDYHPDISHESYTKEEGESSRGDSSYEHHETTSSPLIGDHDSIEHPEL